MTLHVVALVLTQQSPFLPQTQLLPRGAFERAKKGEVDITSPSLLLLKGQKKGEGGYYKL